MDRGFESSNFSIQISPLCLEIYFVILIRKLLLLVQGILRSTMARIHAQYAPTPLLTFIISGFFQCQLSCQCAFLLCAQLLCRAKGDKKPKEMPWKTFQIAHTPRTAHTQQPPCPYTRWSAIRSQIEFHIKFVSQQLENSKATRKKDQVAGQEQVAKRGRE